MRVSPAPKPVVVPHGIGAPRGWGHSTCPAASVAIARLDVEHPIARFILTVGFYLFHHAVFALMSRLLLAQQGEAYLSLPILIASLVNATIAMGLFPLLDKFRKPS